MRDLIAAGCAVKYRPSVQDRRTGAVVARGSGLYDDREDAELVAWSMWRTACEGAGEWLREMDLFPILLRVRQGS